MSALDLLAATNSTGSTEAQTDGMGIIVSLVIYLAIYLVGSFLLSRVFVKAGRPAWAAFVPIYNLWVLFEISGKPGWWVLFILIPFIGGIIYLVLSLLASLELAKRFGKDPVFGVFALWLFSIVGYVILAFDSSKYQNSPNVSANGNRPASSGSNQTPTTPPSIV